jgi:drug/metabolite transporter (DMT)-like permease
MGGSVLSGLAYTFVRKLRSSDAPLTIIFYLSWIGAVGSLPFALLGDGWVWPPPVGWLLLLGVGVTTQVGQFALTRGLHLLEAGTATAIGYVQILFAFLWAVLFFGDTPDTLSLVGAAVILSSVLLIVRRG